MWIYVHYVACDRVDAEVRGFLSLSGLCLCLGRHWFVWRDMKRLSLCRQCLHFWRVYVYLFRLGPFVRWLVLSFGAGF